MFYITFRDLFNVLRGKFIISHPFEWMEKNHNYTLLSWKELEGKDFDMYIRLNGPIKEEEYE